MKSLSRVRLLATPWTAAHQAPPSMGFSRQEYWSGLPFPSPGELPDPGIEPSSLILQADALTSEPTEFKSDGHCIYYCGLESLRRNGVALIVNKRVWNAVLGCNLINNRMISVSFQGKPFNITVIQVYALSTDAKEGKVDGSMKTYITIWS